MINGIFLQSAFSVSRFIPSGGAIGSFLSTIIWGLIICTIIIVASLYIKNLLKYQYYGIVLKKRQNDPITGEPRPNIIYGKAGYFKTKSGRIVFKIKYGKMPWQILQMTTTPDPNYMMGNLVIFEQIHKDNFVQAKIEVDYNGSFVRIFPVDDDTRYGAQLEMSEYKGIFNSSKVNGTVLTIGAMTLILVTGIIVMYFVSKGGV